PALVRWGEYVPSRKPLGRAVQSLLRAVPLAGMPPKAAGLLFHCGDLASAYLLRRALYLEGELDTLLDKSWIDAGVERLSTVSTIGETVEGLNVARVTVHAQVAALESCWYMRNQLLRDTDWSSMAHGLEVRVPFADAILLERIGPGIASAAPPSKQDLAGCAQRLPAVLLNRRKTGFTTPVRRWISRQTGGAPA